MSDSGARADRSGPGGGVSANGTPGAGERIGVAIVGAGPYGLSLAAHLRAAGVPFRQFGKPMAMWRESMPRGMLLKSPGFASALSSPDGEHTLEAFCAATGTPYESYGLPVPVETFAEYGLWFCREQAGDVEQVMVTGLARAGSGYEIVLADGERLAAANVVVATGVQHFAMLPRQLSGLPPALCTHSSAHADLSALGGQRVIVLGAGQSALESAALLHESGARVQLVARKPRIAWNGALLPADRPLRSRLRQPVTGLGAGWGHWFYCEHPELFRRLPERTRAHRSATVLGPAGAAWLAERVSGKFPVFLGHELTGARADGEGVRLEFRRPDGTVAGLTGDHVIAATGYRADVQRLNFLDGALRSGLAALAGAPVLDRHFQSSVPGLYFIGPPALVTFGPLMRFVCGADYAARTLAGHLARTARSGRWGRATLPVDVG
jgi:FAD-dependent urate hydroxylase